MHFLINDFTLRLGGSLLIAIIFITFRRIFRRSVLRLFNRLGDTTVELIEQIQSSLQKPLESIWLVIGFTIALYISPFIHMPSIAKAPIMLSDTIALRLDIIPATWVSTVSGILCISFICWAFYNLVAVYETTLTKLGDKFSILNNTVLVRFTSQIIRVMIFVIGILTCISFFGNLNALLTGVGVGGVVFTLIAQDTLKDILNGVVLMIDKPFVIGDWVQIGDIEGVVEDVSFRSTRIRTFTQSVVILPNSTLSGDHITNWSAMPKRRVFFNLGLTYSTSHQRVQLAIEKIKAILHAHPDVDPDSYLVYFDSFGDHSLDITIYYFSLQTSYAEYTRVKEDINLKILEMANENGLDIAFPTQTIIVEEEKEDRRLETGDTE